jgi:hypothetical protein
MLKAVGSLAHAWNGECLSTAFAGHYSPLLFACAQGQRFGLLAQFLRSQGLHRDPRSIQRKVIDTLLKDQSYCLIFDDDGAGEAADVVAVREISHGERRRLDVEFYHCKFSMASTSGARVDDLYAVCGQAQKSVAGS